MSAPSDAMGFQGGEHSLVRLPAVKDRIEIPADVCRGGRRNTTEKLAICSAINDRARLMTRLHHAQAAARVEMEVVHVAQAGQRHRERRAADVSARCGSARIMRHAASFRRRYLSVSLRRVLIDWIMHKGYRCHIPCAGQHDGWTWDSLASRPSAAPVKSGRS
jgi:hypothetical protein